MKSAIKRLAANLGYEIRRHSGEATADAFMEQVRLTTNQKNPTIFDVGANVGNTCLHYKALFPDSTLYAFEPFPETFEKLRGMLRDQKTTFLHAFGLADLEGNRIFNSNTSPATNSLFKTARDASKAWGANILETQQSVSIPFTTLDSFSESHRIAAIDILKLDVQGAELLVLKGARRMLEERRIRLIYSEMLVASTYEGQPDIHETLEFLHDHHFQLFNLYNLGTKDGRLRQMDAIFLLEG